MLFFIPVFLPFIIGYGEGMGIMVYLVIIIETGLLALIIFALLPSKYLTELEWNNKKKRLSEHRKTMNDKDH